MTSKNQEQLTLQKEQLFDAIKRNDAEAVDQLLEQGMSPVITDKEGNTPLWNAIANTNNLQIVKSLVNAVKQQATASAEKQYARLPEKEKETRIKQAVNNAIKDYGNITAGNRYTPLMLAIKNNRWSIFNYLLQQGIDVNYKTTIDQQTPLMLCCTDPQYWNYLEKLLHYFPNMDAQDAQGYTALMYATQSMQIVRNNQQQLPNYPQYAKHVKQIQAVIDKLLEYNPDINITNKAGQSVLVLTIANNYFEIVPNLLKGNPDLDAQDAQGNTVTMRTIQNKLTNIFMELMKKDPDLEIKNKQGKTAIMLAADSGNNQFVIALLQKGVNLQAKNNKGKTVLDLKNTSLVSQLKNLQKLFDYMSTEPSEKNDSLQTSIIQAQIKSGHLSMSFRNQQAQTPLMLAVIHNHPNMVRYFLLSALPSGPEIDAQDRSGNTALHYAVRMNNNEMMNLLLDSYANCNLQDHDGYTPLMLAVLNQDPGQVTELIANEANLNLVNKQGQTAADIVRTLPSSPVQARILQLVQTAAAIKTIKTETSPTTTNESSNRTSPLTIDTGIDTANRPNVQNKAPLPPSSEGSLGYSSKSSSTPSDQSSDIHSTSFVNTSSKYKKDYSDQKEDDDSPSPIKPPSPR